MPQISVIVPVYKVEPYLRRCVDSILAQTFKDFELILVDDGSPDNCPDICDEYAQKDERVKVIHKENGGLSSARNAGIDWAFSNSSEWITFIDSDDWVHSRYLELLHNAVIRHRAMIAMSILYETSEYYSFPVSDANSILINSSQAYIQNNDRLYAYVTGKLFAKTLFENIRFTENRLWEDLFTTYRLLYSTSTIVFVDSKIYYYFQRNNSIVKSNWSPKRLDIHKALKEQYKFFKKKNDKRICLIIKKALIDNLYYGQYLKLLDTPHVIFKRYWIFNLRTKIRAAFILYNSKINFKPKTHPGHFEFAFPIFMWFYWRILCIYKKFFLQ